MTSPRAPSWSARWTTSRASSRRAAKLVTPSSLAERASALPGLSVEVLDPVESGLRRSPPSAGRARRPRSSSSCAMSRGAPKQLRLALVGKAVTFDAGGYFLKPQSDIVARRATWAAARRCSPRSARSPSSSCRSPSWVLPACENMIGPDAIRPSDVITTAAGLTVEVTNPDAEGRLILADALWYARAQGATHVVDLATLTGHEGRDGRPLRGRLRQRPRVARSGRRRRQRRGISRGPGRCTGATAACSSRRSPICATPRGGPTGIRSAPRRSSSTSPARARGRTSTCSAPRSSRTIAATSSAPERAATAFACSSSWPHVWPPTRRARPE